MRCYRELFVIEAALLAVSVLPAAAAEVAGDSYKPVSGISGNLNSVGSDTLNNLMTYWAEGFRKVYPNVNIQVEGKGSATAPPALTAGTAQLGPMSREMKPEEEDAFAQKNGYKPLRVTVALDCLAVFVHKDNPLKGLSLEQVDGIFSKTRKRGGADIVTWGQLGLTGDWKSMPISVYGRNSASGTYAYFKEHTLSKGDFKDTVKEQPGSAAVINSVANDRAAIGYSGVGYKTSEVRAVPLAENASGTPAEATFENALAKKYPLGRALYVYVNVKPGQKPDRLIGEFLKYILSKEGQEIVVKDGYGALPAGSLQKQLKMLN